MTFDTLCVHGQDHKYPEASRSITVPIYQTAAFSHLEMGHNEHGFDYTRISNPTRQRLEETVAALEGAAQTLAVSSGMAAISAAFELFAPGDQVICSADLYGGTTLLFRQVEEKNGVHLSFVDTTDLEAVRQAVEPNTKAIYVESPSNPMMNVTDIRGCAAIAKAAGALLIVDNTFLSPYLQNPIALGADLVIHSGTKFLAGHNDTISGFVCCKDDAVAERLRVIVKCTGAALSPFDCFLTLRGIKTLPVRMERQQQTAMAVAKWLKTQPKVKKVYYTGLPDHPGYALNASQARGAGAMLSFDMGSQEQAIHVLKHLKLATFAESLGGPETLVTHPVMQTHRDVDPKELAGLGITGAMLRMSVGLEGAADLIEDLRQAMEDA